MLDTIALILAALALGLAAVALLWDQLRRNHTKHARCPKCRYDLADREQSLPITCPECGRTISKPKHLHKPHRRWRLALAALPLLIAAHYIPRVPDIRARGIPAAIPTTILVLITPASDHALFSNWAPPGPLFEELESERLGDWQPVGPAWQWQRSLWTLRLKLHARAQGRDDIRFYNVADLCRKAQWPYPEFHDPATPEHRGIIFNGGDEPSAWDPYQMWDVIDIVQLNAAAESWRDNGGEDGLVFAHDTRTLIVVQSDAAHEEIERLLTTLRHPVPIPARSLPTGLSLDEFGRCVIAYDLHNVLAPRPLPDKQPRAIHDIRDTITETVATDSWRDNAGHTSTCFTLGEHLVIATTPDIHRLILDHLNALLP